MRNPNDPSHHGTGACLNPGRRPKTHNRHVTYIYIYIYISVYNIKIKNYRERERDGFPIRTTPTEVITLGSEAQGLTAPGPDRDGSLACISTWGPQGLGFGV